jgi:hypothetical protein
MRTPAIAAAAILLAATAVCTHAQTCDELVCFSTYDGTIEMSHFQALNNCCCSIDTEVILDGYLLDIHEYEILEGGGCDCLCCFDIEVVVAGLDPGDYTVTVVKHTEYGGTEYLGPWIVTVTGTAAPSVRSAFVPCVDTAVPEDGATWGVIKALYR